MSQTLDRLCRRKFRPLEFCSLRACRSFTSLSSLRLFRSSAFSLRKIRILKFPSSRASASLRCRLPFSLPSLIQTCSLSLTSFYGNFAVLNFAHLEPVVPSLRCRHSGSFVLRLSACAKFALLEFPSFRASASLSCRLPFSLPSLIQTCSLRSLRFTEIPQKKRAILPYCLELRIVGSMKKILIYNEINALLTIRHMD